MLGVIKVRAGLLGVLALLLVGAFSATSASANPGPLCWHRENSKDTGAKIPATAPEPFFGEGGEQILESKLNEKESFKIVSTIAQIKGVIYNATNQAGTAIQCQIKAWIHYQNPKLAIPEIKECVLTVGEAGDNNVQLYGEFMWKYEGNPNELTEQPQLVQHPDLVVWPAKAGEVVPGGSTIPSGEFTKINFGSKCGVFSSLKIVVKGNVGVGVANHEGKEAIGEWDTKFKFAALPEAWQHFWVGTTSSGSYSALKPALTAGKEVATYKGPFAVEVIKRQQNPIQELALKEGP